MLLGQVKAIAFISCIGGILYAAFLYYGQLYFPFSMFPLYLKQMQDYKRGSKERFLLTQAAFK